MFIKLYNIKNSKNENILAILHPDEICYYTIIGKIY